MLPNFSSLDESAPVARTTTNARREALFAPAREVVMAEVAILLDAKMRNYTLAGLRTRTGGLSPWQVRKVNAFVDDHIDQTISLADLSKIVGLSAGYFSRAFRR